MGKKVDIDEYLQRNEVELTLNGKTFVVKDIPEDVVSMMREENSSQKEIVKKLLNCEDKDLEGYGVAAFAGIVKNVTDSLFPPTEDSGENL